MSSQFGKILKISIFGQSHSPAIGVCIDGLSAGIKPDMDELKTFMKRRAPGWSGVSSARQEEDNPEIISGLVNNVSCGAPLTVIIRNSDIRSGDYNEIRDLPRPSHADYTAYVKYKGNADYAGGGHFSGRLTAALCAAGGLCLQILREKGIDVCAHILQIGSARDDFFDPVNISSQDFAKVRCNSMPVLKQEAGDVMIRQILDAKEAGDSVGGIIECAVRGLPAGIGDPIFEGMENRIAGAVFGIPGVKGLEFGNGFECAALKGSRNNDSFYMDGDKISTRTNNSGGIQGGITNGMPLIFRAAIKPTPSINMEQESVSLSRRENAVLKVKGRHDPCIVPRAVPCIEAAAAIAIYDAYLNREYI